MLGKACFALCMVLMSHASNIRSNSHKESNISSTISVQRIVEDKVYNFLKLVPTLSTNLEETTVASEILEADDAVVEDHGEDVEETTLAVGPTTASPQVVISADEDGETEADTSDGTSDSNPADSSASGSAPGDGSAAAQPEQPPAEAVPGQPGEDALDSSSSSSSEESSSSSSEEYKSIVKKAWEHKIKNELNLNRPSKSKDLLARISPLSHHKIVKPKFSKRL